MPTIEETKTFLASKDPKKRDQLIDRLLASTDYANYFANKWSSLLRNKRTKTSYQRGNFAFHAWIRDSLQQNKPYDQFVREVVGASGEMLHNPAVAWYREVKTVQNQLEDTAQLFLGTRIQCAQCHHHPFEKWAQRDYFALAGMFTGVKRGKSPGGGQKITDAAGADLKHPRTGQSVPAAGLGSDPVELADPTGRRQALSDWMTAPTNPFLARTIANRLWAHYFGRGLVEPIDDHRATNPASNEKLLRALTSQLREQNYDLKAFTRTLLASRAYQLASSSLPDNELDSQNYSHATQKALPAEVLLDAICQATGVPERFNGWPIGSRAIEIWDNRLPSYFFRIFGRPQRVSVCECERGNEPSISQALHLMNSPESFQKIRHRDGRAAALAAKKLSDEQVIDQLFLATLSRLATDRERKLLQAAFTESSGNRREAVEDILWTLLNTKEFLYNH